MKTVLFIESKSHVRENFMKLLGGQLAFFNVVTAETVAEGIDLIHTIKTDLVITGRQMDAKEVDLLDQHLRRYPDIKLIVMAGRKSQVTGLLKAFEYNIQFELPVDIPLLLETLLSEFGIDYGGQIRGISIAAFLQMIELEEKTCVLKILSGSKAGFLYFRGGELINAQMHPLENQKAAFAILELENPLIIVDYDAPPIERKIHESLMSLLLKSGRIKDERKKRHQEKRRYKRFPCSLPVEFVHNEWTYKAAIKNIGLSGAFIATENPFSVNDTIDIAFYSHTLGKGCRIAGVVVRRATHGIGIVLKQMSINQMAILRTIINEVAGS